ncbi:Alpha/beta hydrolase family-domain-containing protein [Mycena albidolilacea]|uniref:Alpha/beta hydrolase family-domain-containing protein n=1 Tax=Mycena albidolilacea TaxID=1033008 RepID=A0AAD7AIZ3_9AGAR|nr:Alpha/beta hydrolase family-domain-containing protein [Mycena albidolilacea]
MPFTLRNSICAFAVLFHISCISVASGQSCDCSSAIVPVHVDVLLPKDPTDPFGGLKSNASSLRRLNETYDVFGVYCQPKTAQSTDVVQLLVHGFTYTNQYWSPATEEFRNQSYTDFACDRGLPSFAIDLVGVGLSSRPTNASDVQYATHSAVVTQLARHLKTASILPGVEPFKKVIGIGHSAGSVTLIFGAVAEADQSPFDGLILTGNLIIEPGTLLTIPGVTSARNDTPLRWGALDPDYTTTNNRSILYPTDPTSFSPRMLIFDAFTKDVGTVATFPGLSVSSLTTNYTGPVTKVVGSKDQGFCTGTDRCDDVAALTATERVLWPEAKSFQVIVAPGSGHCMNLDFLAKGPFNTFVNLVNQFVAL